MPDPAPEFPRNGIEAGKWEGYPYDNLPPDCPVSVHGVNGEIIWVSDANGQLVALIKGDAVSVTKLFGHHQNYCEWAFPRWAAPKKLKKKKNTKKLKNKEEFAPPKINGLEYQKLFRCFVAEGSRRGMFDPEKQHEGRGGWRDKGGEFIWHSGESLWSMRNGRLLSSEPGEHRGKLYSVQYDILTPWQEYVDIEESPAQRILLDFRTWNWGREILDPILLIGWMVTALMGGALNWRPIIYTTGGAGVGKSTLHGIIQAVLDSAVMATADTTAAGIRQTIQQDSTAVIVDEFEGGAKNRSKRLPVIDLARVAASGADSHRGSSDHSAQKFTLKCSFFFSSIRVPELETSDKSRMAILDLTPFEERGYSGEDKFVYSSDDGRMILRQIMQGWKKFTDDILPDWQRILHKAGFNQRAIDTYATLLAAAELVVGKNVLDDMGLPIDEPDRLGQMLADMTKMERGEQKPEWLQCVEHLLTASLETFKGGEKQTVGSIIEYLEEVQLFEADDFRLNQRKLISAGLSIKAPGKVDHIEGLALCVPPGGQGIEKLFEGSDWEGGGWMRSLKQAPKDVVVRGSGNRFKVTINRVTHSCIFLDLKAFDHWQNTARNE